MPRIPISTIQREFWTELKAFDEELFAGTPAGHQYYELVLPEMLPLKIRLDIYCRRQDYQRKGYLTIRVFLNKRASSSLHRIATQRNCVEFSSQFMDLGFKNTDPSFLIEENRANWKKAIKWFHKNVQKIVKVLS